MFDLDVEVQAAFASVRLRALGVGALELAMDLIGCAPDVLLPSRQVPLSRGPLQILLIVIELFQRKNGLEDLVALLGGTADLIQHLLVLRVQLPVALEIVLARVIPRKLQRACLFDWLVETERFLVAVLVKVLHSGHSLDLLRR